MPDPVLEGVPVLGHVARQGLGTDGKVNTGSLEQNHVRQTLTNGDIGDIGCHTSFMGYLHHWSAF